MRTNRTTRSGCRGCRQGRFETKLEMAFQPIVDMDGDPLAYEALVRGPVGQSADSVIAQVTEANRYGFDQACRVRAIELASELGLADALLSINFMPNAVYRPEACIHTTLEAARRTGFPADAIIFEFTENERITDVAHVKRIQESYREMGFKTAIDDFGAGHSGLSLLSELRPDYLKIDMQLVRDIDTDRARRSIVGGIAAIARDLDVTVIAEGIETEGERAALNDLGIRYFQGYLFAKPGFRSLPCVERTGRGACPSPCPSRGA